MKAWELRQLVAPLLDKIGWPANISYNGGDFYHADRSVPIPTDLAACAVRCWIEDKIRNYEVTDADGFTIRSDGILSCVLGTGPTLLHALIAAATAGLEKQP